MQYCVRYEKYDLVFSLSVFINKVLISFSEQYYNTRSLNKISFFISTNLSILE